MTFILQVLCLLMGKKWPISFPPSPSAQPSPLTWKWSAFIRLTTTTQVMWAASSCGLRLVQGAGRWFLIGCSTKLWTASSSAVPSHSPAGKCWFSDDALPVLLLGFVMFVFWCQSCLQCLLTHTVNHKVGLFLHCLATMLNFEPSPFFFFKATLLSCIQYFIVTTSTWWCSIFTIYVVGVLGDLYTWSLTKCIIVICQHQECQESSVRVTCKIELEQWTMGQRTMRGAFIVNANIFQL